MDIMKVPIMRYMFAVIFSVLVALLPSVAFAQDHGHLEHSAPYAGFDRREIKSLSDKDLEDLSQGAGWGFALPAELNGFPGPRHLLELQDEINLSADQAAEIEAIFDEMKEAAIAAGRKFIAAERAIDRAFALGSLSDMQLRALIEESAKARADLRFVHLSRHLQTVPLLTVDQITHYNRLRGYLPNPCITVPKGHDAETWRRHNNCE